MLKPGPWEGAEGGFDGSGLLDELGAGAGEDLGGAGGVGGGVSLGESDGLGVSDGLGGGP